MMLLFQLLIQVIKSYQIVYFNSCQIILRNANLNVGHLELPDWLFQYRPNLTLIILKNRKTIYKRHLAILWNLDTFSMVDVA